MKILSYSRGIRSFFCNDSWSTWFPFTIASIPVNQIDHLASWLVAIEKPFECFCKQLSSRTSRCHKKKARDAFLLCRALEKRFVTAITGQFPRNDRYRAISGSNGVFTTTAELSGKQGKCSFCIALWFGTALSSSQTHTPFLVPAHQTLLIDRKSNPLLWHC